MGKTGSEDRRTRWVPPPRPEWVRRLNEEGYCMDIGGVVPLDFDSLVEAAMRSTGLSDFGTDDWREPLRKLVDSLEQDAALNLTGRIRTRSEILLLLKARLEVEETYKRFPEIEDEEIHKPIFIIGQGRSGTSFLQFVLAADPRNQSLMTWEAFFPCPPPEAATYATDPRIERADKLFMQWVRVTPTLESMANYSGRIPIECIVPMAMNFTCSHWVNAFGQIPSFNAYLATVDLEPSYRYLKRVLKLLQWKNPREHWILKAPVILDALPTLLKVYPDACLIWPHRDPVRSLASVIDLVATYEWGRSDFPLKYGSYDNLVDAGASARRLDGVIDQIESGIVPKRQLCNLLYSDLVGNTLETMEGIYRYFGMSLSAGGRAGMERYLRENPREARPPHQIDAGTREMIARDRIAYQRYQDYFGVPNEL